MPDWQERITRETQPAIRAEHDARYRLAAPLIATAPQWCDLGCGTGIAAAAALAARPARAVLVDLDERVAQEAAAEIGIPGTQAIGADLATADGVERVLGGVEAGAVVTCFEVVEHLATFVPLLERLVERDDVTTILSVPNDAFWAIQNPHHQAMWGEGAFAELESQLPATRVLLKQVQLQGSAIAPDGTEAELPLTAAIADGVPTHFLAAFGPRAGELQPLAAIAQVDLTEERRWVRQREADNAMLEEFRARLNEYEAQFTDWRTYIHELEGRLGLPLSGEPEQLPAGTDA